MINVSSTAKVSKGIQMLQDRYSTLVGYTKAHRN